MEGGKRGNKSFVDRISRPSSSSLSSSRRKERTERANRRDEQTTEIVDTRNLHDYTRENRRWYSLGEFMHLRTLKPPDNHRWRYIWRRTAMRARSHLFTRTTVSILRFYDRRKRLTSAAATRIISRYYCTDAPMFGQVRAFSR